MATANEILFRIAARTDPSLNKTLTSTSATINSLGDEIKHLNNASGQIDKYKQLKKTIVESEKTYQSAQHRVAQLAREMRETDKPTRKMKAEFDRATKEAGKLKTALQNQKIQLHDVRGELDKAGISTKNFSKAQAALEAQSEKLAKTQNRLRQLDRKQTAIKSRKQEVQGKMAGTAVMAGGLIASVLGTTKAYGQIADAQGEIASLGISPEGINQITAAAKQFSNQWAGTTAPEFIRASYDIKSGIASLSDVAVGEMTKIAGITAVATKSSTAEMTSLFAKGYGIYRKQFNDFGQATIDGWDNLSSEEKDIKFGKYFSAGISSAVQMFRTDGSQMSQALSTLGADATTAGHSYAEQLAVLGSLQQTMSGSEAATKYRAFLDKAASAGDKLNLKLVDANNNLLSTPEILTRLKGKYGDTLDAMEKQELAKAFGTKEAVAMINLLYGDIGSLQENIDSLNGSLQDGTSVTLKMANAINAGPNKAMALMKQRTFNVAASMGKLLTPAIMVVASGVGYLSGGIDYLINNFPVVTSVVVGLGAGFIALRVAQLAYQWSSLQVKGTLTGVQIAMTRMRVALSMSNVQMRIAAVQARLMAAKQMVLRGANMAAAGAQWVMNTSMYGFPLVWILAAIAGVIAGVWLLVDNWQTVTGWFTWGYDKISGIWNSIDSDTQNSVLSILAVVAPFIGIPLLIANNWDYVKTTMADTWQTAVGWFMWGYNWFMGIWDSMGKGTQNAILGIITVFAPFLGIPLLLANNWDWFKQKFGAIWQQIEAYIPDWAKSLLGIDSKSSSANISGMKVANNEHATASMADALGMGGMDKGSVLQKLGVTPGDAKGPGAGPSGISRPRSGSEVKGPDYTINIEQTINMHGVANKQDVQEGMDQANRNLEKELDDVIKRKKRTKFEVA